MRFERISQTITITTGLGEKVKPFLPIPKDRKEEALLTNFNYFLGFEEAHIAADKARAGIKAGKEAAQWFTKIAIIVKAREEGFNVDNYEDATKALKITPIEEAVIPSSEKPLAAIVITPKHPIKEESLTPVASETAIPLRLLEGPLNIGEVIEFRPEFSPEHNIERLRKYARDFNIEFECSEIKGKKCHLIQIAGFNNETTVLYFLPVDDMKQAIPIKLAGLNKLITVKRVI